MLFSVNMHLNLLACVSVLPLLGSFVLVLAPRNNLNLLKLIALNFSSLPFIGSLLIWSSYKKSLCQFQFVTKMVLLPALNLNLTLGIDGLSLFFLLLTTLLIPICILLSWDSVKKDLKEYLLAFLVLEFFLILVFGILDLLLFYIFFESVLILMFLIVGIGSSRERKILASFYFFLYTLFGSVIMLLAIVYIYYQVGTTDYEMLLTFSFSELEQKFLWFAFFLAFAGKVPMVPVHLWLPKARVESRTASSVILAGVLLKLGIYGLIRYSLPLFPNASFFFTPFVYTIAVVGTIYTSFIAIRQSDFKRIIALFMYYYLYVLNRIDSTKFLISIYYSKLTPERKTIFLFTYSLTLTLFKLAGFFALISFFANIELCLLLFKLQCNELILEFSFSSEPPMASNGSEVESSNRVLATASRGNFSFSTDSNQHVESSSSATTETENNSVNLFEISNLDAPLMLNASTDQLADIVLGKSSADLPLFDFENNNDCSSNLKDQKLPPKPDSKAGLGVFKKDLGQQAAISELEGLSKNLKIQGLEIKNITAKVVELNKQMRDDPALQDIFEKKGQQCIIEVKGGIVKAVEIESRELSSSQLNLVHTRGGFLDYLIDITKQFVKDNRAYVATKNEYRTAFGTEFRSSGEPVTTLNPFKAMESGHVIVVYPGNVKTF